MLISEYKNTISRFVFVYNLTWQRYEIINATGLQRLVVILYAKVEKLLLKLKPQNPNNGFAAYM